MFARSWPILLLALLVLPPGPARTQPDINALRRRLLCAQLGFDLTSPLGAIHFQRCLQQAPIAAVPHPRPLPQLVTPAGPLLRANPPAPTPIAGGDGCSQGFVWREAIPTDHVCVTPGTRSQTWDDNAHAAERVNTVNHDYGPDTCVGGFVWREATPTDHVCVTPDVRQQTGADNAGNPAANTP